MAVCGIPRGTGSDSGTCRVRHTALQPPFSACWSGAENRSAQCWRQGRFLRPSRLLVKRLSPGSLPAGPLVETSLGGGLSTSAVIAA